MARKDALYDNPRSPSDDGEDDDEKPAKKTKVAGRYLDPAKDSDAAGMLLTEEAKRDPGNDTPEAVTKKILKMGRDAAAARRKGT
jgi:hypothetical protein